MKNETLVINMFAGPGAGKSTLAAGTFFRLKCLGVNAEIAPEYAKDLVWEESLKKLENQIYIFGKQYHRMNRLMGKVDVMVADSPLLLSWVYEEIRRDALGITGTYTLKQLILEEFNAMNTINFFLRRLDNYEPKGRTQKNIGEAIAVDDRVQRLLDEEGIPYYNIQVIEQTERDKRVGTHKTVDALMDFIPRQYLPDWY